MPRYWGLVLLLALLIACAAPPPKATPKQAMRGELVDPTTLASDAFADARFDTTVFLVRDEAALPAAAAAATSARAHGRRFGYWFAVGRDAATADQHPEWMATLDGHDEWRLDHADAPATAAGEVVVTWPWVPVAYAEAWAAHRDRLSTWLSALPPPDVVFLSDLQGPPGACGCGNMLCRWACDYTLQNRQPSRLATPLGPEAAADFVRAVQAMLPAARVVPVWVTECEEDDTVEDGACHGVGCYHGACWREFDRQWAPLRAAAEPIALLLPYRAFGRDLPRFGATAGWVRFAIEHLRAREAAMHQRELPGSMLVAVLQGHGERDAMPDVEAQVRQAAAAGVTDVLIARTPIEQAIEPRLRRATKLWRSE
jgi:hypothetical protein